MKKLLPFLVILITISVQAQSSVAAYIGVGQSAFDLDETGVISTEDQAAYLPIGAQITLGEGMLQFGADLSYSAIPFTFEFQQNGVKVAEIKIDQLFAGGFLRVNIGNEAIQPYVKAGGGAYMGKLKIEPEEGQNTGNQETEYDFETAFGFYGAVGLDIKLGKTLAIFGELPLHIVKRKLDIENQDTESFTANNWSLNAGIRILFK